MINYEFDSQQEILHVEFTGEITVEELNDYIISIRENKELPDNLKILSDASKGKFAKKIGRRELLTFLEENKKSLLHRDTISDAFVLSSSFEMALGMLYRAYNDIENYQFNVFSSKEAAFKWLKQSS